MYTCCISYRIFNVSTPYLHIDIVVLYCILIVSNKDTGIPSVTVALILVLGGRFDGTSVL